MSELIFLGGAHVNVLPGDSRGFAYGDGVFETMRVHHGNVHWWTAHRARMEAGAERLGLTLPSDLLIARAQHELFGRGHDGVAKLIVTRGGGARGYARDADAHPVWRYSRHPLPPAPREGGLVLRWCATALAVQPALAGLKHCNRLEQVLARGEWDDPAIDEGLMRSTEGDVVCATSANLFVLHGDRWSTPMVDRCGVAGTCRAWLLSQTGAAESRMRPADVESADAVLLCNAVRGILPVARIGEHAYSPHPAVAELRQRLARVHPGFAAGH
ncbi:Aminodeoxychorismate lyase [Lysobacter dokdonensis DS-58]|uniref:Aminodeoxychorismate lyase n=1 Tax=Lysobacter dokdonensis DS-58 TaxID=1300345 RepID=A0A0A2WFG9_9GAMM|nr:aminodeoxychorismate lyase [Lysobacter dokdonensis]KGQ18946.1 Aminodeoxychorismate lyase [Lysobacter dokdonensis DS-58]